MNEHADPDDDANNQPPSLSVPTPAPPAVTTPEKKFLGVSLGDVVKMFIGGLLVYGLSWVFAKEPRLVHDAPETIPFKGDKKVVGIYVVAVSNTGSKEADDVTCVVRVPGATIDEVKATPSALNPEVLPVKDPEERKIRVARINRGETLQVSVLASAEGSLPELPEVVASGRGVTSRNKNSLNSERPPTELILSVITFEFLTLIFIIMLCAYRFRNLFGALLLHYLKPLLGEKMEQRRQEMLRDSIRELMKQSHGSEPIRYDMVYEQPPPTAR